MPSGGRYSGLVSDFWRGILEEARRPPTPRVTTRPPLHVLQSARETAAAVARALQDQRRDRDERAFRAIFQLIDDFRSVDPDLQEDLVRESPDETGDPRFDAFLAATVEHLTFHAGISAPAWARGRDAVLPSFWFPSPFSSTHARALIESPAAFRRRGIFIENSDLHRV